MAHIKLPQGLPGIRGLLAFRPETAAPLSELAEILLRGPSSLSSAERELIGAYVSSRSYRERAAGVARDGYADLAARLAHGNARARKPSS